MMERGYLFEIANKYFIKTKKDSEYLGIVKVKDNEEYLEVVGMFFGKKKVSIRKICIQKSDGKII